jgi:AraC-like DNA-binding protein
VDTTPVQPDIKIWSPKGFEGLELERTDVGAKATQPEVLMGYGIQVVTQCDVRAYYQQARHTVQTKQPTVVVQNPGEVFAYEKLSDTPLVTRSVEVTPDFLKHLTDNFGGHQTVYFPDFIVGGSHDTHLARLTHQTFCAFQQPVARLERESHLVQLFRQAINLCAEAKLTEPRLGLEHHAVTKIKAYLHEKTVSEVSLEDLSSLTKLNKYHLLQIFKRDVGISPHLYQTSLRIHRAKQQLATGTPIAQVALDVGFVDQSHFGRQFKKYVRVTPGQFQRDTLNS